MDKRFAWTGLAIAAVTLFSLLAVKLPQAADETLPIAEAVSDVELPRRPEQEPQESQEPEYVYMLREYEGRIGVFQYGSEEPEQILDVPVKYLPEYDQVQMAQGIPCHSYQELTALMEDYTS